MVEWMSADRPYQVAESLRECVCAAIANQSPGGPVGDCCVHPGQPVWNCEPACRGGVGGQVAVEVTGFEEVEAARTGPGVRGTPGCATANSRMVKVDLRVTVLRCMPGGEHDGKCGPSCDCLGEVSRTVYADAAIARAAVQCCGKKPGSKTAKFKVGKTQIVGPNGGCVGSELLVSTTVCVPACEDLLTVPLAGDVSELTKAIVEAGGRPV